MEQKTLWDRLKARYLPANQAYAVVDEIDPDKPETWHVFRIFSRKVDAQACVSYCNQYRCLPKDF